MKPLTLERKRAPKLPRARHRPPSKPLESPLRWVGGKRKQMDDILSHVRRKPTRIVVPFLGGGSSALAFRHRYPDVEIYASDGLEPIIRLYRDLSDPRVVETIRSFSNEYIKMRSRERRKAWYYDLRQRYSHPGVDKSIMGSALLFTMLRTCYSGMYRTGKQGPLTGKFNTPCGFMIAKNLCDFDKIETFAEEASTWHLEAMDYRDILGRKGPFGSWELAPQVIKGSVVYFDPPYRGTYDGYSGDGFDQSSLCPTIRRCIELGASQVIMSQSADHDDYWREGLEGLSPQIFKLQRREGTNRNVQEVGRPLVEESLIVVSS